MLLGKSLAGLAGLSATCGLLACCCYARYSESSKGPIPLSARILHSCHLAVCVSACVMDVGMYFSLYICNVGGLGGGDKRAGRSVGEAAP